MYSVHTHRNFFKYDMDDWNESNSWLQNFLCFYIKRTIIIIDERLTIIVNVLYIRVCKLSAMNNNIRFYNAWWIRFDSWIICGVYYGDSPTIFLFYFWIFHYNFIGNSISYKMESSYIDASTSFSKFMPLVCELI